MNTPIARRKDGNPDNRFGTIAEKTGKDTVHVHTLLFKDDMDTLKEIAYQQRKSTNELIREIINAFAMTHRKNT